MNPGHDGPRGRTNEDTTRQKEGKTGRSQYGEKDRNGGKNEKKGHEREKNRKIKKKKARHPRRPANLPGHQPKRRLPERANDCAP